MPATHVVIRHNQNVNDSAIQNSGHQTVAQSKREWFRCIKPWLTDNQNVNDSASCTKLVIRQWHNQNVNDLGVQNCGWLSVTQSKREWFNCTKLWLSDSDTIKTWMIQLYKPVQGLREAVPFIFWRGFLKHSHSDYDRKTCVCQVTDSTLKNYYSLLQYTLTHTTETCMLTLTGKHQNTRCRSS